MAHSRHHGSLSRPNGIEEIVERAQQFEFGSNRSLKSWLRSAQMLLTEAAMWEHDGNLQMAYLFLYRHATLVISKFPTHPDYKDPKLKADIAQANVSVKRNLTKLEQWKPRIKREHERYLQSIERRDAETQRIEDQRLDDERQRIFRDSASRNSVGSDGEVYGDPAQSLNAHENQHFAVDVAHHEIRRRDATRQSTKQAGIPPAEVASRRRGFVLHPDDDAHSRQPDIDKVSEGVREAGRYLHRNSQHTDDSRSDHRKTASTNYQYPTVPAKEDAIDWKMKPLAPVRKAVFPDRPPSLPAKELPQRDFSDNLSRLDLNGPPIPPKARDSAASSPPTATPSPPPTQHISSSKYTFTSNAFSESGAPLRTVMLPPELRSTFLNLAHPNTLRNLETCGILCGTLISNALFINHLIIPDQISTSDTCDTTEEGDNELFDFCDSNDLLVCGWIHTHPSQTCFLSSRDLHTSSGYQIMLPEAIAIVCAPRHNPDWGIFRLTDPPGLNHILNCQQQSLFHPHSETNLYTDAIKPGHVIEGPGLKFKVADLRKQ